MQQHHPTASMSTNTSHESHDQEFKKTGEDMSDNDELQKLDSRRRRPCFGDENEAPQEKKQTKNSTCSAERNESNDGGGTAFQECNPVDAENGKGVMTTKAAEVAALEDTGRERLKRHRVEVAGRVWIPDIWGQEELLKDWIDCCAFDSSLMNSNIMSAREALMEEGRRATSSRLTIENSC